MELPDLRCAGESGAEFPVESNGEKEKYLVQSTSINNTARQVARMLGKLATGTPSASKANKHT